MNIAIYNQEGEKIKDKKISEKLLKKKVKTELLHQVIIAQLANLRQPLAHTKDRSEVRGGGKKPWRQKGTGRARHGSIRSPLWKGGGVTFGPRKEKKYKKGLLKKMKKLAALGALQEKIKTGRLLIINDLKLEKPKTKEMISFLNKIKTCLPDFQQKKHSLLLAINGTDNLLTLTTKNLPRISLMNASNLNAYYLTKFQYLIITEKAFDDLEEKILKII